MAEWTYEAYIPHGSGDAEWRVMNGKKVLAVVDPDMKQRKPEKLAALMAAAPEMLAALKEADKALDALSVEKTHRVRWHVIRAAIAHAEGKVTL